MNSKVQQNDNSQMVTVNSEVVQPNIKLQKFVQPKTMDHKFWSFNIYLYGQEMSHIYA